MRTFPIVFTGHVDHGKSTLVARLLLDTGYFPDGKLAELQAAAQRRGVPLEISFLLDSFQVERDQAVTIDATRIWFSTATRRYAVIDAPGHREFVRHMVSGAADALAAVVVVDAVEGIGEQTRRHALLLPLVGVTRAIVAINKMDAVAFDAGRYAAIVAEVRAVFAQTRLELVAAVPTVARDGENVVRGSARMGWYDGPTLLAALEALDERAALTLPLRFSVQDVYRRDEERILVGTVAGGRLAKGMTLAFAPTRDEARVMRIVRFPANGEPALAGEAVGLTLDHPIFVGPGDVAGDAADGPVIADSVSATVFWLDRSPLRIGEHLRMRCGTRDTTVVLEAIAGAIDIETFADHEVSEVVRNDIARVTLRGLQPLVVDPHPALLGRFALYRGDAVGGGGIVRTVVRERSFLRDSSPSASSTESGVRSDDRTRRFGHRGLLIWLTGPLRDGKPTIASRVESALFGEGWNVYLLDGSKLRQRTAQVGALFADAGCVAIVANAPPLRADRAQARAASPVGGFLYIHLRAAGTIGEDADVHGRHERDRTAEDRSVAGVSLPHEEPDAPDLALDIDVMDIEACVQKIAALVRMAGRA